MSPETAASIKALADAGLSVVLMVAVAVLWRKVEQLQKSLTEHQDARLAQQKADADRLLEERTMVLPLVRDSTDALRRTADQMAINAALISDQREQLARRPNGIER